MIRVCRPAQVKKGTRRTYIPVSYTHLLLQLHRHGGMSQKELVGKLMVKPPTVTVMIKRMEKSGFIQRKQDEQDQRVSRIYLTELGEETFRRLLKELKIVEAECFADFTEDVYKRQDLRCPRRFRG